MRSLCSVLVLVAAVACERQTSPAQTSQAAAIEKAKPAPTSPVDPDGWWTAKPCCGCEEEEVVSLGTRGSGLRAGHRWTGEVERMTRDGLRGEQDLKSNAYKTFVIRVQRASKQSSAWRVLSVWGCNGPAMLSL